MKEFRVIIPDENYDLLNFRQSDLPGVAVINSSLKEFEPKEVFSWHCSVMIELKDLVENGMPSKEEVLIIDKFGDWLDEKIKGVDKEKPNALFLARITWNETRELIWRVFDPEVVNNFLTETIKNEDYSRDFDYRIEKDKEWKLAKWHLANHKKRNPNNG